MKAFDLAVFYCRGCISCVAPVEGNEGVLEIQAIDCTPALVTMEVEEKTCMQFPRFALLGMRDEFRRMIVVSLLQKPSKLPEILLCTFGAAQAMVFVCAWMHVYCMVCRYLFVMYVIVSRELSIPWFSTQ